MDGLGVRTRTGMGSSLQCLHSLHNARHKYMYEYEYEYEYKYK